jgi:glycosyltransferase involved in cell wall biosynthesis
MAAAGQLDLVSDAADLRPHYADAALCVVPLRAGGGTRLKILEAMAFGRAVISSPIGCEGLATEFLTFAAGAPAFAAACIDSLESPESREALTQPARRHVERHHDWSHLATQLAEVHRLGGGR